MAAAAFAASSEASIGDPHAFNHFKSVRGSASSSVGVNAEQEVASESASCHGLQLRLWIAAAVTTDCHTDKRVACSRPLLAFCSLPLIPAAAAEVVRVWMVALRRSLIVARSVSSETKAKKKYMLLRAQKSMIDGPRFLLMALYPRVCLNATLLQHILQSLQDFEVALNTYSSPVVPKLKSYFTIEGEFFNL